MNAQSELPGIIIAEDDGDFRTLLATLLRWDGHTVRECEDGQKLCDFLIAAVAAGQEPNLVIADIIMPGMTGLAACQHARDAGCTSRFIFMSTFNEESMLLRAMELGPEGIFRKPFEIAALQAVVSLSPPGVRS